MSIFTSTSMSMAAAAGTDTEASEGILAGLGIDWMLLVLQLVSFLILVWVLQRFVYPVFFRIIEERQSKIDESLQAARDAEDTAAKAQAAIDKQLDKARHEARDIVATAKDEAAAMLANADKKSKSDAENIVKSAQEEIAKDVLAAKKALHNETIELVALATGKVIGATHTGKVDAKVIESALKEARN